MMKSDSEEESTNVTAAREEVESRIATQHSTHLELLSSLQPLLPDLVSSLDLSLKLLSSFSGRPFTPTPPLPPPSPNPLSLPHRSTATATKRPRLPDAADLPIHHHGTPLSLVRSMVALSLLERLPFTPIDSSTVLRKLENDHKATPAEKAALRDLGGGSGAILAVEMALRSMAEADGGGGGGVELEEFVVSGKSRVMVLGIDRTRLVKELPETANFQFPDPNPNPNQQVVNAGVDVNGGVFGMSRPMPEMWMGPGPMFSGGAPMPRMMGLPRGMGLPPLHRPMMGPNVPMAAPNSMPPHKLKSEEDDIMKDVEALLNKKSFKEMEKLRTDEELLDLLHRPTAKETAVAAKFKTKGGSQLKEYCSSLTKEDCRRQSGSFIACEKVHFRRIIAPHTDINLGDCSFLDTCRHMKTCKYVHYELDPFQDMPHMPMGAGPVALPKTLKPQRAEYCSEVELGESQWINCDIRNFQMDILGKFGVIMADPPWDIHMELPYGTMADDEMRNLNVPALQTDGLIFLWVTGRAMELGRECLELWGYKRVEELIWVKTNQLQRIIRTGRTGHWLNHSKEHCLIGIKGSPIVNRNIDTDVVVAEVRETSRKPDEMYSLLERVSPRTRKLELFARMHNTHAGWISLGNQLSGARLVDEGLRARFKAAYPNVAVEPASPPRASMEVDSGAAQLRSPFAVSESKPAFEDPTIPEVPYAAPTPTPDKTIAVGVDTTN